VLIAFEAEQHLSPAYFALITIQTYLFTYAATYFGQEDPGLLSKCLWHLLTLITAFFTYIHFKKQTPC
jgi:hypothetical protein